MTEEEILVAKDMEAKRLRRIQRAEARKQELRVMRSGKAESMCEVVVQESGLIAFKPKSEEEKARCKEYKCSGVKKQRPLPRQRPTRGQSQQGSSRYPMRVRESRPEGQQEREAPGWDFFEGKRASPAETSLQIKRRCGYNRLRVVESTIPGAGHGLFLRDKRLKAGGMIASYEGARLTKATGSGVKVGLHI